MPVYNAERYVRDAIRSILDQTYRDFKLLIIDDGSTDESLTEIKAAVSGDMRCSVIERTNRGVVAARNECIELCEQEFVCVMDADDICGPSRLREQVDFLDRSPECVAVGTRVMIADTELMPIVEMIDVFSHHEIDRVHMTGEMGLWNGSVMMRAADVRKVGGYVKEYEWAEDIDLFLRLAEVGKLANLESTLCTYRQHVNSVGYKKRGLQVKAARAAICAAAKRRGIESPIFEANDADYSSVAEAHRKWAWQALFGRNIATARKHALKAFLREPFSKANLLLIGCAARGR